MAVKGGVSHMPSLEFQERLGDLVCYHFASYSSSWNFLFLFCFFRSARDNSLDSSLCPSMSPEESERHPRQLRGDAGYYFPPNHTIQRLWPSINGPVYRPPPPFPLIRAPRSNRGPGYHIYLRIARLGYQGFVVSASSDHPHRKSFREL